jgi:hypothetical protein
MKHARTILSALCVASLLAAGGCKEEETPTLFDEGGAWSLVRYDLTGQGDLSPINTEVRENAFMLLFNDSRNVVTTAACIDPDAGTVTPVDSLCRREPSNTQWECKCYAYAFEESLMKWVEFSAGTVPPSVSFDGSEPAGDGGGGDGGGGGGSGTAGGTADGGGGTADGGGGTADGGGGTADGGGDDGSTAGGAHTIQVNEVMDQAGTYTFRSLPAGVFGSNGESSRFIFQTRSPLLFDQVFEDPEGRPSCEPCI